MNSPDYPDACTNCPAGGGHREISWSSSDWTTRHPSRLGGRRRTPVFTNPGRAIIWGLAGWAIGSMIHSWDGILVVTILAALAGSVTGG